MMKSPATIIILLYLFLACQSKPANQSTEVNLDENYTNVVGLMEIKDTVFIDADYVQYLTGDSAIEAAKRLGRADTFTIDGITHIDVPNDYIVLNESEKIRRLRLSKDVSFDLVLNMDTVDPGDRITDNSLVALKKHLRTGCLS